MQKNNISELQSVLNDCIFYGVNKNISITMEMRDLIKKHPWSLDDIAHLYNVDEKKTNDIYKYTFVGKQWKCDINQVNMRINKIISLKPILKSIDSFIKNTNQIINLEYESNIKSYISIGKKIMIIFDLFIEFLRENLV